MSDEKAEQTAETAAPGEGELHKPPSVLWLVIPLALIMLYAALTR